MTAQPIAGPWSRAERVRLGGVVLAVAVLHVVGWSMYLYWSGNAATASAFAGAGTLAYALGVRHAFDADHIAAIDDTTRLMLLRGRRPVGVGFFFALGHSAVVFGLAVIVALASGAVTTARLESVRHVGALVAAVVATLFLLLVAGLNAVVLAGLGRLWRQFRAGHVDADQLDLQLLNRGLLYRLLGSRARTLVRSSWHMAPVGFLFGLGLETASEVTLLALSASTASAGAMPTAAVLTLPLLFAAGMSAMDTADSLLMTRAYTWAHRSPGRRLYYNLATTAMTVAVGGFVASVYLAGLLAEHVHLRWLDGYAAIGEHFELLGYLVVGAFVTAWVVALAVWRLRGYERRFATADGGEAAGATAVDGAGEAR